MYIEQFLKNDVFLILWPWSKTLLSIKLCLKIIFCDHTDNHWQATLTKKKSTFSYQEIFNIDNNIHCYTRDKTPMQSSSMDIKLITIKFRKVATSKGGDKLRLIYLFSSKSLSFYYITCLLK